MTPIRRHTSRVLLIFVGVLLAAPSPTLAKQVASDTVVVDLGDAVARALSISPEIAASHAAVRRSEARASLARASRFLTEFELTSAFSTAPAIDNPNGTPTDQLYLDPDVRNDWENGGLFSRVDVSLLQPVFTWGELGGNIRAAEFGADVDRERTRATRQQVTRRTAELYYSLLLTEALYRVTEPAASDFDRAIEEIQKLIDEGDEEVDVADLYDVRISQQEFISGVVQVEQRLQTAAAALSRQMMLPEGTTVRTQAEILETADFELLPLSVYQDMALGARPEIAQITAGQMARQSLVTVARSDYFPKIFIAADARYSYASNRYRQRNPFVGDPFLSRSFRAGIGIRQSLNFSQTKARVEQATAEVAVLNAQEDGLRQLVLFEVESAYRDVIVAQKAVESSAAALLLSKEWLSTERVNFDLGIGDSQNLVRVVKRNLEAMLADYQARFNFNMAVLELLSATGSLEESLQNGIFVEP